MIQARVQQLMAKDAELLTITRAQALTEMSNLAMFNFQDLFDDEGVIIPIEDLPPQIASSVREIKGTVLPASYDEDGKITMHARVVASEIKAGGDKRAAIDMALRIHNAYEDHEGAGSGVINIYMDEKDRKA